MLQFSTLFGTIFSLVKTVPKVRLKGKKDPVSSFSTEFSTAFGVVLFAQYFAIKKLLGFLQVKQINTIKGR